MECIYSLHSSHSFSGFCHPEMFIEYCFTVVVLVIFMLVTVVCSPCHWGLNIYFAVFEGSIYFS